MAYFEQSAFTRIKINLNWCIFLSFHIFFFQKCFYFVLIEHEHLKTVFCNWKLSGMHSLEFFVTSNFLLVCIVHHLRMFLFFRSTECFFCLAKVYCQCTLLKRFMYEILLGWNVLLSSCWSESQVRVGSKVEQDQQDEWRGHRPMRRTRLHRRHVLPWKLNLKNRTFKTLIH